MVEGFENAAFELNEPGDVTDRLVRTSYGYHIIRLVDRKIDAPMPADSAAGLLWKANARNAERDLLEGLQMAAEVRVNPDLIPGMAD